MSLEVDILVHGRFPLIFNKGDNFCFPLIPFLNRSPLAGKNLPGKSNFDRVVEWLSLPPTILDDCHIFLIRYSAETPINGLNIQRELT